jgi:hypothetical protein
MVTYVAKPSGMSSSTSKSNKKSKPQYVSVGKEEKRKAAQAHAKLVKKDPILMLYDKPITVNLPWYVKYFFMAIYVFVVIVIFLMLNAILQNQTKRKWWNGNGGKKYNKVFSINLLAQYRSFTLGYSIWSLFVPVPAHIPGPGAAEFIINLISAFAKLSKEDNPQYFMLPIHVCENIAVGTVTPEMNQKYTSYVWPQAATDAGLGNNTPWSFDPTTGWPNNQASWKKLLYIWGVPSSSGEERGDSKRLDLAAWQAEDNFLYSCYLLPGDTQFIYSFMWGTSSGPDGDTLWYPESFSQCVGLNPVTVQNVDYSGGWWGMVKYGLGTDSPSLGLLYNYLYASYTYTLPNANQKCTGGQVGWAVGSSVAAGLATAAGLAAFVNPFTWPVGIAALAGSAGSLIGGLRACGTIS